MTFPRPHRRRPSMTRKSGERHCDTLLHDCRVEMLATFTADGLARFCNITVDKAARKLAIARQVRLP